MSRLGVLKGVLWLWVLWHLIFGLLATFAPEMGARSIGWSAEGGWDAPLLTMSTQYGMVMLLLALMYLIMALDPLSYLRLLSIAIVEQFLGIIYAVYIFATFGQLTIPQLVLQSAINVVAVVVFALLWSGLRSAGPAGRAA